MPLKENTEFEVFDLGLVDFVRAWQFQKEVFAAVKNNYLASGLILCRHFPVVTLGRAGSKDNILASPAELEARCIRLEAVERGGDVTYHGPGQLTAYPVFNLCYFKKDIRWFLRVLEDVTIDFLAEYGVYAQRKPGLTGVWVEERKIASIGIAIKNWITFHGLSINIKRDDLDNFQFIRPCGRDIEMTSLESVLEGEVDFKEAKTRFRDTFACNLRTLTQKEEVWSR